MSATTYIHVVKKSAIAEHAALEFNPSTLPSLETGLVRARAALVSLTYNTLTYARLGTVRNWWDAFPVPPNLPAPYGDRTQYGICPCWGWGTVIESRLEGIKPGLVMWGYWPFSGAPVDLQLVNGGAPGHLVEVSEQRKTLMPMYNR
ncbi:hypothetical protein LTR53_011428, partial [Teratosphaeriaceae sp. CCFEE 6253]